MAFSNEKMSLTILGVDPGSRVTGYGVIRVENGRLIHVAHGVILPEVPPLDVAARA